MVDGASLLRKYILTGIEGSNPSLTAIFAGVAQSVEQRTRNAKVAGSIPAPGTIIEY